MSTAQSKARSKGERKYRAAGAREQRSAPPRRAVSETGDPRIGEKLRLRRKVRRLSLQSVAAASGISIGQLSQIERGISAPSLRSLRQICQALDMPMGWLFDGAGGAREGDGGMIVRAAERRAIALGSDSMVKELLTPDACTQIQMMRILIRPGGASGEAPYTTRGGARCATVLQGTLGIEVDGRSHLLEAGDTFAFEATHDLRFWCEGSGPCEVIWAVTPAIY